MKQEDIEALAERFLKGSASIEDRQNLNKWYDSFNDQEIKVPSSYTKEKEEISQRIFNKLKISNSHEKISEELPVRNSKALYLKIAASILLVLSLTYTFYQFTDEPYNKEDITVTIQKSTKIGQRSKIRLPDGTIVHLNAQSSLAYPETFDVDSRNVELVGEAFFEVVRDEKRPFTVKSEKLMTTVLGTTFSIKSYPGENIEHVWVASGKVQVEAMQGTMTKNLPAQSELLLSNQGVVFDQNRNRLKKETVNVDDLIAWKDGWLILESKELGQVISILERWYGTKIIITDPILLKKKVTIKQQNENLEAVMEILGYLADFEYKIQNKIVTITRNN
ncbi:MAG: FecR domain-containing protein [Cyclobacteriaceae bacterium]|jgi:transmembrane sensor|nr:FecR domain-containing protein [Cyclobacteriaceae bacterium]